MLQGTHQLLPSAMVGPPNLTVLPPRSKPFRGKFDFIHFTNISKLILTTLLLLLAASCCCPDLVPIRFSGASSLNSTGLLHDSHSHQHHISDGKVLYSSFVSDLVSLSCLISQLQPPAAHSHRVPFLVQVIDVCLLKLIISQLLHFTAGKELARKAGEEWYLMRKIIFHLA